MKRFRIAMLAVCVLLVPSQKLVSQSEFSLSDTTWIYDFQSETDSAFSQIKFHGEYDSADMQIITLLISDEMDGGWKLGTKFRNQMDQQNRLILQNRDRWNADLEVWEESFMYQYFYDGWGNDTLYYMSYKYGTDYWVSGTGSRKVNSYDEQDQLVRVEVFSGYPGQESEYEKYEYSYDESGNRILTIRYSFAMDWVLNARYETGFDAQGRKVEEITYCADGNDWVEGHKTVYEYDADGNNTMVESSGWDPNAGQWKMYDRDDITYDPQGRPLVKINQNIAAYQEPLITTQYEYFYNLSGKLARTVISILDEGSELYVLSQKEFTRYGGDYTIVSDSICRGESYFWEGETLDKGGRYQKDYVSAMGLDSILILYLDAFFVPSPFLFSGASEVVLDQEELYIAPPDPELEYRWAVENGTVVSGASNDTLVVRWEVLGNGGVTAWALNDHGCSSDTSSVDVLIGPNSVEDLSAAGILFYPVPVKDLLYSRTDLDDPDLLQIGVTDLSGREVAAARGTSIDLSHLPAGTYVVRLKDSEGILIGTRKIMKE
jgi:hypothetical protein